MIITPFILGMLTILAIILIIIIIVGFIKIHKHQLNIDSLFSNDTELNREVYSRIDKMEDDIYRNITDNITNVKNESKSYCDSRYDKIQNTKI